MTMPTDLSKEDDEEFDRAQPEAVLTQEMIGAGVSALIIAMEANPPTLDTLVAAVWFAMRGAEQTQNVVALPPGCSATGEPHAGMDRPRDQAAQGALPKGDH